MKILFWIFTLLLTSMGAISAAGQQPALIDRSLFFGEIPAA